MEKYKEVNNKGISFQKRIYPLFDEVESKFIEINSQFQDLNFETGIILNENQEKSLMEFFNRSDFDYKMQNNVNSLSGLEQKLNVILTKKNLSGSSLSNKIIYNLNEIERYKTKIHDLQAIKHRLNSMNKNSSKTENSLALNEASSNISQLSSDNKNKKEDVSKENDKPIKYVDNIGDKEKTYLRFHEYNHEKNQNERISLVTMINKIDERMKSIDQDENYHEKILNDDENIAFNRNNLKSELIGNNNYLLDEKEWCMDILRSLKTCKNYSNLDAQMKNKLESYLKKIDIGLENNRKYAKNLDNKLVNNKEKYDKIIIDQIEQEISDLYINKVTDNSAEKNNDENFNLSIIYEKFVIISRNLSYFEDGSKIKKEYTEKLQSLNLQIKEKLSKQTKSQNKSSDNTNENSSDLKIKNFYNFSEDEKAKIAKNPAAISKLFEAVATGELKTGSKVRKLTEDEKSHLSFELEDIYMYKLRDQGLVDINVNKDGNSTTVKVINKNKNSLNSTLKISGSIVLRGKENKENANDQSNGLEL